VTVIANPEYRWKSEMITPRDSPKGKPVTNTKGQLEKVDGMFWTATN
jgi:hypothetical protein